MMPRKRRQEETLAKTYSSNTVWPSPFGCDVHTHTIFSRHAYSTIGECVAAAKIAGLELLGSCDHYSPMLLPKPCNTQEYLRVYQHFINFGVWPRLWDGVYVMRGVEADIVDLDGHLFGWDVVLREGITGRKFAAEHTLKGRVFRDVDYAIASIHNEDFTKGATLAQTTNMYVRALQDPKVIAIGHPGRAGVPFDVDAVLCAAKDLGKLIEINEHSFAKRYSSERKKWCRHIALRCAELEVMVSVATDAHIACDVGRFDATAKLLDEIHFPTELIATRSKNAFLGVLEQAVGTEAG